MEVTAAVGVVLVMSVKAVLFVDVLVITAVCTAVVLVTSTLSNVVVSVTVGATSATVIVSVSVGELFGKLKRASNLSPSQSCGLIADKTILVSANVSDTEAVLIHACSTSTSSLIVSSKASLFRPCCRYDKVCQVSCCPLIFA